LEDKLRTCISNMGALAFVDKSMFEKKKKKA